MSPMLAHLINLLIILLNLCPDNHYSTFNPRLVFSMEPPSILLGCNGANPAPTTNHGVDATNHVPTQNNGEGHPLTKNHGATSREKFVI